MDKYWKSILVRAWHTVWETAAATLPASIVITPTMIEHFDTSIISVVLAWIATALVAGGVSLVKSLAVGIPEADRIEEIEDEMRPIEVPQNGLIKNVLFMLCS